MNVEGICTRKVVTALESDDLTDAAELMRENHIGYLIVVEPGAPGAGAKPIGVLTDRDIVVSVVSRQTDPRELRVGDVMSRTLVVVEAGLPVTSALTKMRKHGIRRLPVIGSDGHLVGVLSLDDILVAFAAELQDVVGAIQTERLIEGVVLRT
jgi:CBS domain-containing protein